jgi:hypothetical protein
LEKKQLLLKKKLAIPTPLILRALELVPPRELLLMLTSRHHRQSRLVIRLPRVMLLVFAFAPWGCAASHCFVCAWRSECWGWAFDVLLYLFLIFEELFVISWFLMQAMQLCWDLTFAPLLKPLDHPLVFLQAKKFPVKRWVKCLLSNLRMWVPVFCGCTISFVMFWKGYVYFGTENCSLAVCFFAEASRECAYWRWREGCAWETRGGARTIECSIEIGSWACEWSSSNTIVFA